MSGLRDHSQASGWQTILWCHVGGTFWKFADWNLVEIQTPRGWGKLFVEKHLIAPPEKWKCASYWGLLNMHAGTLCWWKLKRHEGHVLCRSWVPKSCACCRRLEWVQWNQEVKTFSFCNVSGAPSTDKASVLSGKGKTFNRPRTIFLD